MKAIRADTGEEVELVFEGTPQFVGATPEIQDWLDDMRAGIHRQIDEFFLANPEAEAYRDEMSTLLATSSDCATLEEAFAAVKANRKEH